MVNSDIRKPTEEEYRMLCEYWKRSIPEFWEDYAGADEFAVAKELCVTVFPNYSTDCVGYQGKVFVTVWPAGPEFTETLIEERGTGGIVSLCPVKLESCGTVEVKPARPSGTTSGPGRATTTVPDAERDVQKGKLPPVGEPPARKTTWELRWAQCPTNYNRTIVSLIEAETADDAYELLRDGLKKRGITSFALVGTTVEYAPPKAQGKVVNLGI